jgi:hypothetical protein
MCDARRVAVALLSVGLVTQIYSIDAAATVVNVDEFAVVRNGTTIFDDSFNRNITLNGGSGTVLPSGTTFSDGTAANYRVVGSFPETTANTIAGSPGRNIQVQIRQTAFERRFSLADHMKVTGASLDNGLLYVEVVREVPEAAKPRTIKIGTTVETVQPQVTEQKAA